MSKSFRELKQPKRTYKGPELSPYRMYKKQLAKDFNNRCGYSDCPDFWFGGPSSFHIDHFAPKSKFPEWEEEYSNMVYSCSYVNRAKSNDWVSNDKRTPVVAGEGYLDPCETDFNDHFERDSQGNILVRNGSAVAIYMHKKLKLYLKRYSIIWTLDRIRVIMDLLSNNIEMTRDKDKKEELLIALGELSREFLDYLRYLEAER